MADDIPDIYADGARLLVNPAGFTLSMTLSVPAEGEQQQPVAVVNVVRLNSVTSSLLGLAACSWTPRRSRCRPGR